MNKDEAHEKMINILNEVDDFYDQIYILSEMFLTRIFSVKLGNMECPEQIKLVEETVYSFLKTITDQSYKILKSSPNELIATVQKSKNRDINNADYYDELSLDIKKMENKR